MNHQSYIAAGQLTAYLLDRVCCTRIALDDFDDLEAGVGGNTAACLVEPDLVTDGCSMENHLGCLCHALQ